MTPCAQLDVVNWNHVCTSYNARPGIFNPGISREGGEFKHTHGKLRTAKAIYEGFMRIFISLRCGDAPPSTITHFDSAIDKIVQKAGPTRRRLDGIRY